MNTNPKLSKNRIYWILQFFGWLSLSFSGILQQLFANPGTFDFMYLTSLFNFALPGIIITHIYKEKFISLTLFSKSFRKIIISGIKGIFIVSLCLLAFSTIIQFITTSKPAFANLKVTAVAFVITCVYVCSWFVIYFFYKILERSEEISSQKLMWEIKSKTSELSLLKSQLNPEFLFQSLSNLRMLALEDKDTARDAIIKLSEILRFSLYHDESTLISLKLEFLEVKKYLELYQLNPENNFNFTLKLKEETLAFKIPQALCLTVAELIVQNMLCNTAGSDQLTISSSVVGHKIVISIFLLAEHNIKIDFLNLSNTKLRLQSSFGTEADISIKSHDLNSVMVVLNYSPEPIKQITHEKESNYYR